MSEEKKNPFKEYLSIQKSNVNAKIEKQASNIFTHGEKVEHLVDALSRIDHKIELKEAQIYRNMANKYRAVKTVTPTFISKEVICHPEIIELKERRLDIMKALGVAKLKMKTLHELSDLLINYSHNIREERKSAHMKKL